MEKNELKSIGVNVDNLEYPFGEMNIIVQCLSKDEEDYDKHLISCDVYQPRKNKVWNMSQTGETIDLSDENQKNDHIKHLKDSAERLKIMSYLLSKQAEEIEKYGYPKTTCYYPE